MFEKINVSFNSFVNRFFAKRENPQPDNPTFSLSKLNDFQNFNLTVDSPIEEHAEWIFKNILPKHRDESSPDSEDTLRFHGMQHASRVAVYTQSLANLHQEHGSPDALPLSKEDKKLLQITGLLHDAGRKADGEDLWEHESGSLTYAYLKKLNVAEQKATTMAEAVVNKDIKDDVYHKLTNNNGMLQWNKVAPSSKNIYQEIIHDADCLDIMRVDPEFEKERLDVLQKPYIASKSAKKEVDDLISDVSRLIRKQDDSAEVYDSDLRKKYEQPKGYNAVVQDINDEFPTLKATYNGNNRRKEHPFSPGLSPFAHSYFGTLAAVKSPYNKDAPTLSEPVFFSETPKTMHRFFPSQSYKDFLGANRSKVECTM